MAIEAIATYSESALELLRRKRIRRDDLFQYLAAEKVVVSPKADKHELIQRVLRYWGSLRSDEELHPVRSFFVFFFSCDHM